MAESEVQAKILEIYLYEGKSPSYACVKVNWYYDRFALENMGIQIPEYISNSELFESNHT